MFCLEQATENHQFKLLLLQMRKTWLRKYTGLAQGHTELTPEPRGFILSVLCKITSDP